MRQVLRVAYLAWATATACWAQPGDLVADTARTNALSRPQFPSLTATSAIVIDRDTGAVLGAKNPDTLRPNPSTTKMMTALLALEPNGSNLDAIVGPISDKAASTYGSTMSLQAGDFVSLRDLLYGLMLPSGNDAAVAISEWIAGDEDSFVVLMNQRAQSLGLTNTSYRNAFGYDPVELPDECVPPFSSMFNCGHYSTVRDLAALARFALQNQPLFAQIVQTVDWTPTTWVDASNNPRILDLHNDNLLLSSVPYAGANGVKTGETTSAGFCMVASATRSGHSIITVVLGCDSEETRLNESIQLLNFGFAQFSGNTQPLLPTINVTVSPTTLNAGTDDATFVITTSLLNPTQPTPVLYTITGRAQLGVDYTLSSTFGEVDIPAGNNSTTVVLHSLVNPSTKKTKQLTLKLLRSATYKLSNPKQAAVTIVEPP